MVMNIQWYNYVTQISKYYTLLYIVLLRVGLSLRVEVWTLLPPRVYQLDWDQVSSLSELHSLWRSDCHTPASYTLYVLKKDLSAALACEAELPHSQTVGVGDWLVSARRSRVCRLWLRPWGRRFLAVAVFEVRQQLLGSAVIDTICQTHHHQQ